MNVIVNQWGGLFTELQSKISPEGRRQLLNELIGSVYDTTVLNFGESGAHRPSEWADLKFNYALSHHDGNTTPTLELTGALKNGFVWSASDSVASLTNTVAYAEKHQFGMGRMYRPFYPVDESGETFTPYMIGVISQISDKWFQV